MKLRMRDNSIRLRLTQPEIRKIQNSEFVESHVRFGPDPQAFLTYRLESSADIHSIQATFKENVIRVILPSSVALSWSTGTEVSLFTEQEIQPNEILRILIEKDFFCLKPRSHDEPETHEDYFPHPNAAAGTCSV